MEKNFSFMAFAKGKQVTEFKPTPKYIGVGSVFVKGVNVNKAEYQDLFGYTPDEEPSYTSEQDINGTKYPAARISFVVKTDPEKNNGIDFTTTINFFLRKQYRQGSQSGKYQIIDKYGRTGWATREEIEAKKIPMYSNGPANIDADYRPCYVGEEELTNFIKVYIGIPDVQIYKDGKWVANPDVNSEDCVARLDNIDKYFTGDFSELKEICTYQPENKIKALFGVRTTDEGSQYQAVFTQRFLGANARSTARLEKELNDRKAAGAYATTEFKICDLEEYVITPTEFTQDTAGDALPWT